MDVVSFKAKVHDQLIDCVIGFVFAVEVVIHHSVGFRLRVGYHQSSSDGEIELRS